MNNVYLNGKFVGSTPYSGDKKTDGESAKKLLAEKGLLNLSSELTSITRQARSFEKATRALIEEKSIELTVPYIVNGCFCIELLLKALLIKHTGKQSGHKLKNLYQLLPYKVKSSLNDRFFSVKFKPLENALLDLNNTFVEWRYMHEKTETSIVSTGVILTIIDILFFELEQ